MPMLTPPVQGFSGLTQQTRLVLEPAPGEQLLMPQTVGAATMSLTAQPSTFSPTTGMHLHVFVIGNTASGTMTFAGTAPSTGSAVTSQTYHINAAPLNNQGYTEFTTKEVFATLNASGIVATGITPCQILILGSCAAKILLPITSDATENIPKYSSPDHRGILYKDLRITQLTKGAMVDKLDASLYPDSLWAPYMLIGNNPNITTAPATPSTLLASTTVAATMTLTTTPVAPGEFLIFAITGNTVAGTIVLSGGRDQYGMVLPTETITVSTAAAQTLYSANRYSALTTPGTNQFTTTGMTGASIAVTGVYAWTRTWTYDGVNNLNPYTACLEMYDGVMGVKLPYTFLTDGVFSFDKQKELAFTAKGEAQDYLIVGDPNPTTYPSGVNPFATLPQPTSLPMVSWPASFFIDPGTGTALATQDGSLLSFKAQINTGRKPFWNGDGFQRWNNATVDALPSVALDASMIFSNYAYYLQYFKPNASLIFGASFQGNLLGTIASTTYSENWTWTFPARIDTYKPDASKSPVEGTLKILSEYSFSLGYAYKLAVTSQVSPNYTN